MILIDGYNLMHAAGLMKSRFGPGGLERARRALIGVLAGSLGDEAVHTTVVFDARTGQPEDRSQSESPLAHGIRVEFASISDGADARIEQLIRLESVPKRLTVVSSDRRIRSAARRRGARAMESEKFWRELVERRTARRDRSPSTLEKPTGRARGNSDAWLREFEGLISDQDLRELAGPFGDESQS
jgi:hypothetical protein